MLALERCPACRARLRGGADRDAPCRRCGTDLSWLHRCYERARWHQHRARHAMLQGAGEQAVRHARRARSLVDEPETRQTLAVALYVRRRGGLREVAGGLDGAVDCSPDRG